MQVQKVMIYALVPWLFVCVSSEREPRYNVCTKGNDCRHNQRCRCRGSPSICKCEPINPVIRTTIPFTTTTTTGYTTVASTKATSVTFSKELTAVPNNATRSSGGGPIANSTKQPSSSDSVVDQTQVDDSGLPVSALAGISAGVIVIVAIVVIVILLCLCRCRKNDEKPSQPSVYDGVSNLAPRSNPTYQNLYDVQESDYKYADVLDNHREGKPETDVAYSQIEKVGRKNTHPVYDTVFAENENEFRENDQNRVHKAHTNSITVSLDEYNKVAKPTRYANDCETEDSTYDVTYSNDNNSFDNAYDTTENRNRKVPRDTTYDVTYSGVKP